MQYATILTGGIACGKSTVASLLALEGYKTIDADSLAHESLGEKQEEIKNLFGEEVLDSKTGGINRKKLGALVFGDPSKRKLLESLLHPLIKEKILKACEVLDAKGAPYFVEIPLYFEGGQAYASRLVACVYAPREIQLQRLIQREGLSELEANQRLNAQLDIEIKKQKSDAIIDNSSSLAALQENLKRFLKRLEGI